jgi:hypothetical protein
MTRRLDLMVDIDEVIFPMMASVHKRAQDKGYHDGTADMVWAGWVHYRLPSGEPLPEDIYWDLWSEFALEGGYIHTPPIEGAVEALRWLSWEGHNIHLVTARGFMANAENIRAWTPQWVEEFAVPHKTLTFAQDKVAVQEELGVEFDAAIDDSPKNFQALREAGIHAFLQDHEHNRDLEVEPRLRVETLWQWAFLLEQDFPAEATA